jgi:phosphoglycerate dehydrogenase-like enzyme
MKPGPLVVGFRIGERGRKIVAEALGGAADILYLADLAETERAAVLRRAGALLSHSTAEELRREELPLLANARLIQFTAAGIDWIPLSALPEGVPVAANSGAHAEPMAEHVVAMILAAAKRLFLEHDKLRQGEFNQRTPNRLLYGATCGIFGYGAVGVEVTKRLRPFGMRIHAINRRGASDEPVDWIATPDRLDDLLRVSDVLVISAALTRATLGIIGARELSLLPEDAILVNVARGEIVDEAALFRHLRENPRFTACLDAWWVEPVRHGRFATSYPFLDLPNVIGSPHNSAGGGAWRDITLRRAVENCRRALVGETPLHLAGPEERML